MDPQRLLPAIMHSTLTGLTVGGTYGLASGERVENPYDTAMIVDEIRFHATGQLVDFLRCKIEYGRQEIAADFLPLDLFGKTLNWEGAHVKVPGSAADRFTTHVWRLPKPLFIPRGGRLTFKFKYQDDWAAAPATVATIKVTCAGRRLPNDYPTPGKIAIPYIASFGQFVGTSDGTFQSSEYDLRNPWPEEFDVERLLFALHTNSGADDVIFGDGTGLDTALSEVTMRMHDSLGAIVLRDTLAIGDVISPMDRSWPLNTLLRSGGYYIVDGEIDTTFPAIAIWLALHGTRNILLSDVGV